MGGLNARYICALAACAGHRRFSHLLPATASFVAPIWSNSAMVDRLCRRDLPCNARSLKVSIRPPMNNP